MPSDLAKQALAPLLLFETLPARRTWQEKLQVETPDSSAPMVLAEALRLFSFTSRRKRPIVDG